MSDHFSAYRINYALRSHKRDTFIEFIKSQLLPAFALHVRPLSAAAIASFLVSGGNPSTAAANDDDAVPPTPTDDLDALRGHYAQIFASIERLIHDHRAEQDKPKPESRLNMLVPTIGRFFTDLPLRNAFLAHDDRLALAARRHVPPSFNEIRGILNTAQLMASAPDLRLITFDGDMTLYDDGANFAEDSHLVNLLCDLLSVKGLHVAIVTAAGYTEAERYEFRLSGLLKGMADRKLSATAVAKFWVMGGECNYLFRCSSTYRLERVPLPALPEIFYSTVLQRGTSSPDLPTIPDSPSTTTHDVTGLLDVAERILRLCAAQMRLPAKIIRKPRAVGIVSTASGTRIQREQLDECALSLQHGLNLYQQTADVHVPYCAFNGGSDVWVDIGNKQIGVMMVAHAVGVARGASIVHVGDQFLSTGNDYAARRGCPTLWITSPVETAAALVELVGEMRANGREVGGE
ncbi:IMP 5'-nucleotidase [Allomyces javanicus]|nr:IMP 5'-nucleotidase [Allomyces javanicus]